MVLERPKARRKTYGNVRCALAEEAAAHAQKHRTTKERLADFYGKTAASVVSLNPSEVVWGKPEGQEVW
jgi:hypothetical protein